MKYKTFLLTAFVALALVTSGCASDSSGPVEENSSDTEGPEDVSDSEKPENLEPSLEVVSLNISDEIFMGGSAPLELEVRNSGNGSGNFTKNVQLTSKGMDYNEYGDTGYDIGGVVGPGETKKFTRKIAGTDIGSFRFSIEDYDLEAGTSVLARDLSLGEDYTNVRGVKMSIDEIKVQETYEEEDGSTLSPDNGRFIFVKYSGENIENETVNPSSSRKMNIKTGEGNYEPSFLGDTAVNYDKISFTKELEPGETLEGYIVFDVNYGAERQDLTVTWKEIIGTTEKRVNWRP